MGPDYRYKQPAGLFCITMPTVLLINHISYITAVIQTICITYTKVDLAGTFAFTADFKLIARNPFLFRNGRIFCNTAKLYFAVAQLRYFNEILKYNRLVKSFITL